LDIHRFKGDKLDITD